ncbi:MAG: hypothetical protein JXQ80_03265, partial [Bacteroidales bacterium]|nr:hypothetical protein [Bacteroidales bacterium]
MPKKSGILRHIADIIAQNKTLSADNENLNKQNEKLLKELEKYKDLLNKMGKPEPTGKIAIEKKPNIIRYRTATVLYADAFGFEQHTPELDPKLLVESLDEIFVKLQHIVDKFPVRGIRTIGDTLMCVGGIPKKNITNPIEVLLAAIEMQYYLKDMQRMNAKGKTWKLRIGIHTGTVVADVSGKRKPHYEVKGDT